MSHLAETQLLVEFGRHPDEWLSAEVHRRMKELGGIAGLKTIWANDWAVMQSPSEDGRWGRRYGPLQENLALATEDPRGTPGQRKAAELGDEIRNAALAVSVHGTECDRAYAFYAVNASPLVRSLAWALGLRHAIVYGLHDHFCSPHPNLLGIELSEEGSLSLDNLFATLPRTVDPKFVESLEPSPPIKEYIQIGGITLEEADALGLPDFPSFTRLPLEWARKLGFTLNIPTTGPWGRKPYGRTGYIGELLLEHDKDQIYDYVEEAVVSRSYG